MDQEQTRNDRQGTRDGVRALRLEALPCRAQGRPAISPYIETVEELAEQVADWCGVYGGGPENGADHPADCKCRICFTGMVERRIRASVENDKRLEARDE